MGVSFGNRLHSVDMGYGRFSFGLRADIASCIDPRLGEEYVKWLEAGIRREEYNVDYLNNLIEEINLDDEIGEFLFEASDCSGSLTPKCCRKIYKIYNIEDKNYGYSRPDGNTATSRDIKEIFRECAEHRWKLSWY